MRSRSIGNQSSTQCDVLAQRVCTSGRSKCPRCALVSICLPEEVNFLARGGPVRPLAVADPETHPLIAQEPGARVRLSGGRLLVDS